MLKRLSCLIYLTCSLAGVFVHAQGSAPLSVAAHIISKQWVNLSYRSGINLTDTIDDETAAQALFSDTSVHNIFCPKGVLRANVSINRSDLTMWVDGGFVIDGTLHIGAGNDVDHFLHNNRVIGRLYCTQRVGSYFIDGMYMPDGITIVDTNAAKYKNQLHLGGTRGVHFFQGTKNFQVGDIYFPNTTGALGALLIDTDTNDSVRYQPENGTIGDIYVGKTNGRSLVRMSNTRNIRLGNITGYGWDSVNACVFYNTNNTHTGTIEIRDSLGRTKQDLQAIQIELDSNSHYGDQNIYAGASNIYGTVISSCYNITSGKCNFYSTDTTGNHAAYDVENSRLTFADWVYAKRWNQGIRLFNAKSTFIGMFQLDSNFTALAVGGTTDTLMTLHWDIANRGNTVANEPPALITTIFGPLVPNVTDTSATGWKIYGSGTPGYLTGGDSIPQSAITWGGNLRLIISNASAGRGSLLSWGFLQGATERVCMGFAGQAYTAAGTGLMRLTFVAKRTQDDTTLTQVFYINQAKQIWIGPTDDSAYMLNPAKPYGSDGDYVQVNDTSGAVDWRPYVSGGDGGQATVYESPLTSQIIDDTAHVTLDSTLSPFWKHQTWFASGDSVIIYDTLGNCWYKLIYRNDTTIISPCDASALKFAVDGIWQIDSLAGTRIIQDSTKGNHAYQLARKAPATDSSFMMFRVISGTDTAQFMSISTLRSLVQGTGNTQKIDTVGDGTGIATLSPTNVLQNSSTIDFDYDDATVDTLAVKVKDNSIGATQLASETGTGVPVLATTPTLVTPVLGVATATSVNKVAITAPATSATLTIADGATLTASATASVAGTHTGTSSGTNTGDQTSVTGNAGTATALQTPRTINGTSFDGTGNITVTAAAGTLTGTTLNSSVVTSSLTDVGTLTNETFVTPTLTLKQGTSPTPTAEGAIEWDTDDDWLVIGDASAQKICFPSSKWTGDVTQTTAGVTAIGSSKVTSAMIVDGTIAAGDLATSSVTSAKILDGEIVNADVNSSAAIAYSKLALSNSVVSGDIAANTIVFSDLASALVTSFVDSARDAAKDSAYVVPDSGHGRLALWMPAAYGYYGNTDSSWRCMPYQKKGRGSHGKTDTLYAWCDSSFIGCDSLSRDVPMEIPFNLQAESLVVYYSFKQTGSSSLLDSIYGYSDTTVAGTDKLKDTTAIISHTTSHAPSNNEELDSVKIAINSGTGYPLFAGRTLRFWYALHTGAAVSSANSPIRFWRVFIVYSRRR